MCLTRARSERHVARACARLASMGTTRCASRPPSRGAPSAGVRRAVKIPAAHWWPADRLHSRAGPNKNRRPTKKSRWSDGGGEIKMPSTEEGTPRQRPGTVFGRRGREVGASGVSSDNSVRVWQQQIHGASVGENVHKIRTCDLAALQRPPTGLPPWQCSPYYEKKNEHRYIASPRPQALKGLSRFQN